MIRCSICGESGGRFVLRGKKWLHKRNCAPVAKRRDTAFSTFPFTTSNIRDVNEGPVTVESMRHLRQLEKEYGVSSDAYNNDQSNRSGLVPGTESAR